MENNAQSVPEIPIKPNRFLITLTYTPAVTADIYLFILVKFFNFSYEAATQHMTALIKNGTIGLKLLSRDIAETKAQIVRETMRELCPRINDILSWSEVHACVPEDKKQ